MRTPNNFFHGFIGDMMDSYTTHRREGINYMRRNAEIIEPNGHATDLFSSWAVEYLHERAESKHQPFFLYLAYNAPHFPIEPPDEWLEKVRQRAPKMDGKRARSVALVEHLDDSIGRVLAALKDTGLAGNTVVVFSSDNGGSLPHAQNNIPWRGGKQDHYDGGLRVPFMVRWFIRPRSSMTRDALSARKWHSVGRASMNSPPLSRAVMHSVRKWPDLSVGGVELTQQRSACIVVHYGAKARV